MKMGSTIFGGRTKSRQFGSRKPVAKVRHGRKLLSLSLLGLGMGTLIFGIAIPLAVRANCDLLELPGGKDEPNRTQSEDARFCPRAACLRSRRWQIFRGQYAPGVSRL